MQQSGTVRVTVVHPQGGPTIAAVEAIVDVGQMRLLGPVPMMPNGDDLARLIEADANQRNARGGELAAANLPITDVAADSVLWELHLGHPEIVPIGEQLSA